MDVDLQAMGSNFKFASILRLKMRLLMHRTANSHSRQSQVSNKCSLLLGHEACSRSSGSMQAACLLNTGILTCPGTLGSSPVCGRLLLLQPACDWLSAFGVLAKKGAHSPSSQPVVTPLRSPSAVFCCTTLNTSLASCGCWGLLLGCWPLAATPWASEAVGMVPGGNAAGADWTANGAGPCRCSSSGPG